jgi:hypothetical protein
LFYRPYSALSGFVGRRCRAFSDCQIVPLGFIGPMAANPQAARLSRFLCHLALVVVGLPLIYLLSVGPAVIVVVKIPSLRGPIHAVYTPMIWLHDHTTLRKPMDKYLAILEQTAHAI